MMYKFYAMGLNKFEQCSPSHATDFEYCCFRSNKVFCQSCWCRDSHPYKCHSTRCGHYEKLAHLVIDKTLEMKVMHHTAGMSSAKDKFDIFCKQFFQLKETITTIIKQDIENKLPLFMWSLAIEMLSTKNANFGEVLYEEGACLEMLRLIRQKKKTKKQCLEEAVNGFQRISHLHSGLQKKYEGSPFAGTQDQDVEQIISFYNTKAGQLIRNIKQSLKKHVELEVKDLLKSFDPNTDYTGIRFSTKGNFSINEGYKYQSLAEQLFPRADPQPGQNYNGMNLEVACIEQNPEEMLEASKCFLKEKVYKIFQSIKDMKSSFPYKYGYVVSTCLKPDKDYQLTILNLEKANIKTFEKKSENPFLSSVNIVVMGPELITFQFKNHPKNSVDINIYGWKEERQAVINDIQNCILSEKTKGGELKKNVTKHSFESAVTPVALVYIELELAYEHLFMAKDRRALFEEEKYAQARGSTLFADIAGRWIKSGEIDFELQIEQEAIIPLFI